VLLFLHVFLSYFLSLCKIRAKLI